MLVTSYGHAAIALDRDGARLTIDPGGFADAEAALAGATAILITHEHPDHVDAGAIRSRLADPAVRVWAPGPVATSLREGLADESAERVTAVTPGDRFEVAGFAVTVGGGLHALIHEAVPQAVNVTYLVESDGTVVYHPGDSFDDPPTGDGAPPVDVLLVPVSGPWLRLGDAMDFAAGIDAPAVVPIHGALLSEIGWRLVVQWLDTARIGGSYEFHRLASGESIEAPRP